MFRSLAADYNGVVACELIIYGSLVYNDFLQWMPFFRLKNCYLSGQGHNYRSSSNFRHALWERTIWRLHREACNGINGFTWYFSRRWTRWWQKTAGENEGMYSLNRWLPTSSVLSCLNVCWCINVCIILVFKGSYEPRDTLVETLGS